MSGQTRFVLDWPDAPGGTAVVKHSRPDRQHKLDGRILVLEDDPAEEDYASEGAGLQAEVLDRHFWFSVRIGVIRDAFERAEKGPGAEPKRLVEYGCSNGFIMGKMEEAGWQAMGVDMHMSGLRTAEKNTRGALVCSKIEDMTLSESVQAVGLFDVIEHVPDDKAVLRHAVEQVKPGGAVVITVPALMSLWSEFDVMLGHKRRYTTGEIRRLFEEIGLEVESVRYFFSFAVPILYLQRRLMKGRRDASERRRDYMQPPHPIVNGSLKLLGSIERVLLRRGLSLPFGSSIIAVARRPL